MSKTVSINQTGDFLVVIAAHDEEFAEKARALGGKWNGVAFVFPKDQAQAVEELCLNLFDAVDIHDQNHVLSLDSVAGGNPDEEMTVPGFDTDCEDPFPPDDDFAFQIEESDPTVAAGPDAMRSRPDRERLLQEADRLRKQLAKVMAQLRALDD